MMKPQRLSLIRLMSARLISARFLAVRVLAARLMLARVLLVRVLAIALSALLVSGFAPHAQAECFELAEQHYGVSAALLRAVAQQESSMNPKAFHINSNGSWDAGLMQINSSWLPLLKRHGIEAHDLMDGCTSVLIGAWILRNNFKRMGKTIQALGAYNASQPHLRERYARQVLAKLDIAQRPSSPRERK